MEARLEITAILLLILGIVSSIGGQLETLSENPDDCSSNQYYSSKNRICRNCSDVQQIFMGSQDWLSREISQAVFLGPNGKRVENNVIKNLGKNQRVDSAIDRNINNNKNNELLSRLINIEPQDQEFTDSTGSRTNNNDLNEDPAELVDSQDIDEQTKQTQMLINRFTRSTYTGDDLLDAIRDCKQYQNSTACQMWSNFCVITMYSHSDDLISQKSSRGSKVRVTSDYERDGGKRVWQDCLQSNRNIICNSLREWIKTEKKSTLDISSIYANDETNEKFNTNLPLKPNQNINLLAYRYSLNGLLLGIEQFTLIDMQKFCITSGDNLLVDANSKHFIRVGQNIDYECKFDLSGLPSLGLRDLNEVTFIDLFIGYSINGVANLKPVPILNRNVLYNGVLINRKYTKDPSRWKLVHRFFNQVRFTLDIDEPRQKEVSPVDQILVFAGSTKLDLKFKRQDRGVTLNSILLTLEYNLLKLPVSQLNLSNSPQESVPLVTTIQIQQSLIDMYGYRRDLDLTMTIFGILSTLWSLIKCYNLQKYYGYVKLDINRIMTFIIISCDTVANLITVVTFTLLGYIFITVKIIALGIQMFPPNEDLDNALITFLKLAFTLKLLGMSHKLFIHLTVDLFFVDWEKPKMLTSSQMLNHSLQYDKNKSNDSGKQQNLQQILSNIQTSQQSSFWRPYTVINNWIGMQTFRRENITIQLILFACIVDLTRALDFASSDCSLDIHRKLETTSNLSHLSPVANQSFRILILAAVYISISLGQITFQKYIYEPMIRNVAQEFVDLCSVANVSLFCMLYPRFGYYIHGRNPNGSGDLSLIDMNALFEREERDLCSQRGLAPNSDEQTFLLILPKIVNDHYRKLLYSDDMSVSSKRISKQLTPSLGQFNSKSFNRDALLGSLFRTSGMSSLSSNRAFIEAIVIKNKAINVFFTNFLEHIYRDIDYSIRDSRRFENLLLDIDFEDETLTNGNRPLTSSSEKSHAAATFCTDLNNSFTSLLWLGLEFDFVMMELLTIIILDLKTGQQPIVLTVSLLWIVHKAFKALYVYCARHNLISKALIDEKFLAR